MNEAISDSAKRIIEVVGCPYVCYPKGTSFEDVIKGYIGAAERAQSAGFTPVIVVADDILAGQLEILRDDGYSRDDVLTGDTSGGEQLLRKRYEEYFGDAAADDAVFAPFDGSPAQINGLSSIDGSNDVIVFEIPTTKPWEIAAYIPFGGWNDCPSPEEMTAVLRYWYEKYGAEPVVITHDVLEMAVDNPVGEEAAAELVREHCAFTPDRVWQCTATGSFAEVAASLAVSGVWYFWWD